MSVFVFLGPTLPAAEARRFLDATYLPPVRMGDVLALVSERPKIVGIVDGFFEQVPAVWHKEILFALESGVRVFGASSMGALRAAELWPFGMEGVGSIFEAFRDGALEDDDEVAVVHGPAEDGYRPLSEALVNVRWALARACDAGALSGQTSAFLLSKAKATFYADRTWEGLLAEGAGANVDETELASLRAFLFRERPNQKRDDALDLLRRIHEALEHPAERPAATFRLERTSFWYKMQEGMVRARTRPSLDGDSVTADHLRDHLRVARADWAELERSSLLLHLVQLVADELGVQAPADAVKASTRRLRVRAGLFSSADTRRWLTENGRTAADLRRLGELEALYELLAARYSAEIGSLLSMELWRRNEYTAVAQAVAEVRRCLHDKCAQSPTLEDVGASLGEIMAWYRAKGHRLDGGLEEHARAAGFGSGRALLAEVLGQYLVERSRTIRRP